MLLSIFVILVLLCFFGLERIANYWYQEALYWRTNFLQEYKLRATLTKMVEGENTDRSIAYHRNRMGVR